MSSTNRPAADISYAELLDKCHRLEKQLKESTQKLAELNLTVPKATIKPSTKGPKKISKDFDAGRYATRHIALKISYLGHRYNGFEHAVRCFTPLPTIEEVLWKALRKTRLISPTISEGADDSFDVIYNTKEREQRYFTYGRTSESDLEQKTQLELNWDGCQYSKCGRTDRGVSAFGQVIGIRVRSCRPNPQADGSQSEVRADSESDQDLESPKEWHHIHDELPYVHILNTVLPQDIRVLAWCAQPPKDFDARFSCEERRYKYFFTNPAFCPTPGTLGMTLADGRRNTVREGWLDIECMRDAAKRLQGHHDYRNFCQIDASKQMPNCERRITFADVEEIDTNVTDMSLLPDLNSTGLDLFADNASCVSNKQVGPKVYAIAVHGSAFLWHQVRCIAAILFMVGQGLEAPDVVDKLLDISATPGRPHYAMADDAPLVLWDCVFPDSSSGSPSLDWIYPGDQSSIPSLSAKGDGKFGMSGLADDLFKQWQDAKIKEAQLAGLLSTILKAGDGTSLERGGFRNPEAIKHRSQKVYEGAAGARLVGRYQSLMARKQMDSLEVMNAKFLSSVKGARRFPKKDPDF